MVLKSATYDSNFAKDIENLKNELAEPWRGKEEKKRSIISPKSMIESIMNTDYTEDMISKYVEKSQDYTNRIIKELSKN